MLPIVLILHPDIQLPEASRLGFGWNSSSVQGSTVGGGPCCLQLGSKNLAVNRR